MTYIAKIRLRSEVHDVLDGTRPIAAVSPEARTILAALGPAERSSDAEAALSPAALARAEVLWLLENASDIVTREQGVPDTYMDTDGELRVWEPWWNDIFHPLHDDFEVEDAEQHAVAALAIIGAVVPRLW